MENHKEFFDMLNRNIRNAKNKKTLKILEKQAKKYVINIPSYADSRLKRECKKEMNRSMLLIKEMNKKLK
jgi:hypothetical protein